MFKASWKVGDLIIIKALYFPKRKCLFKDLLTNIILDCEAGIDLFLTNFIF